MLQAGLGRKAGQCPHSSVHVDWRDGQIGRINDCVSEDLGGSAAATKGVLFRPAGGLLPCEMKDCMLKKGRQVSEGSCSIGDICPLLLVLLNNSLGSVAAFDV